MGQQTILRVQTGKVNTVTIGELPLQDTYDLPIFDTLDLYKSIPIKINKSYAEIQDISKKNSDYSVPVALPGSKKNNKFFETFYNVDQDTLYFDPTRRVPCQVLIDDVVYFKGYLKLNKIAVKESKVEYNVTLYSQLGDFFGELGNNLLSDLNYASGGWNSSLLELEITDQWFGNPYKDATPPKYFFPVVHNGYVYDDDGNVATGTTRLYTSTKVGAWSSPSAAASAGVTDYNLNSPVNGLFINQLKPALSVYHLTEKIFEQYGYTLQSDFKETPWFKQLYMYGYFSSENVLFSSKQPDFEVRPLEDVDVMLPYPGGAGVTYTAYVVKKGTGVPCYCTETITVTITDTGVPSTITIEPFEYTGSVTFGSPPFEPTYSSNANLVFDSPYYIPQPAGTETVYDYGDTWNMNLVVDPKIKQIDFLASLAKKFNLVFVPDPEQPNVIIMEPFQYYIGSGDVKDWSDKLSYDKGFTIEPAQNFVEAEIILTDKKDEDGGNAEFERIHGKVYGTKQVFSNTQFKSRVKKIETIFSPEIIRKWDVITGSTGNIDLPLGINYSESSSDGDNGAVTWTYEGLKSNPKLFYYVDNASPFINETGNLFVDPPGGVETVTIKISEPGTTNQNIARSNYIPIISHTSPIGLSDEYKIVNDTQSILFQSERSLNVGVEAYDAYSKFDLYTRFYENNINNLFNKNTRFLKGKFELDLSDVLNIKPKELIKIKEQYFMWNKISQFNLTDYELTEVELVQYNNTLQEYPTRYFKYWYCDQPSTVYRFKTDMTNPDMTDTRWARSVRYDYIRGATGSGLVTFGIKDPSQGTDVYVGCTMVEIIPSEYDLGGAIDMEYDSFWVYTTDGSVTGANHDLNSYLYNILGSRTDSGTGYTWVNAFTNCADFNSKSTTYGFVTGSSTTHGTVPTATPTATVIPPTPTPTPYTNTSGSLLITLSSIGPSVSEVKVYVNAKLRDVRVKEPLNPDDQYSTYLNDGDVVIIEVPTTNYIDVDVIRKEFTNDNNDGDSGIKDITVTPTITPSGSGFIIEFTVSETNQNCAFEYVIDIVGSNVPFPTATPSPTPTPTSPPDFVSGLTFLSASGAISVSPTEYPLYSSNDNGATFNPITGFTTNSGNLFEIYSNGQYYMGHERSNYYYRWWDGSGTREELNITDSLSNVNKIDYMAWNGSYWLASVERSDVPLNANQYLARSTDGVNWTLAPTNVELNEARIEDIIWDGCQFIIMTAGFTTHYSDGVTYCQLLDAAGWYDNINGQDSYTIDWNGTTYTIGGDGKPNYSQDIITGLTAATGTNIPTDYNNITEFDGTYVHSGGRDLGTGNYIYARSSDNGITYTGSTALDAIFTPNRQVDDLFYNGTVLLALVRNSGSYVGKAAYSTNNGVSFTESTFPAGLPEVLNRFYQYPELSVGNAPCIGLGPTATPQPTATPTGTGPTPTPSSTGPTATPTYTPTPTPTPTATSPGDDPDGYMTNVSFCDGEFICENAIDQEGPWIHMNTPFWSDQTTCNPEWTTLSGCIDVGNYITYPPIQTEGWYALTHIQNSYVNDDPFVIFYIKTTGEIVSTKQCTNGNVVGWPSDQPPFDDDDVTPTPVPGCTNPVVPATPTPTPTF